VRQESLHFWRTDAVFKSFLLFIEPVRQKNTISWRTGEICYHFLNCFHTFAMFVHSVKEMCCKKEEIDCEKDMML